MDIKQLKNILSRVKDLSILVLGDYFLDKYLLIDPELNEKSIETSLTAYQTVGKKIYPGAAGTVTSNFKALGVGRVISLGIIGDDGEGYELINGLKKTGVITENMILTEGRCTPTYIKPLILEGCTEREINRIDIKNRLPTPEWIEGTVIEKLIKLFKEVDAIVVMDQIVEKNHGTITDAVREVLVDIAKKNNDMIIYTDSRANTYLYSNILIKCNQYELLKAFNIEYNERSEEKLVNEYGKKLSIKNNKPVFVTVGKRGQIVFEGEKAMKVLAVPAKGPFDTCGAGDATTSGIISALCCGASYYDAALLGNIVASITIQQIGRTGTASKEQILARHKEYCDNNMII